MSAAALTAEAFAARLGALFPPQKLALAISGGRDSVALLRLCADYARRSGNSLQAFTVNHALRPEAAKEAAFVASICKSLGVAHQTLHWRGDKPSSGVQAAARAARYCLLIEAAQATGCEALLTAHTMDDQAETLFMRLSRGAGLQGLSAMRAETAIASGAGDLLRLLRPMLGFSREAVTAYLGAAEQTFIDDPSNDDPAFERVRVRALLAALAEQEIIAGASLAASAEKLAAADLWLADDEDKRLSDMGGVFHGWGGVSLDRWPGSESSCDYKLGYGGLARRLIYAVGGGEFPPNESNAMTAMAEAQEKGAATLAGALVRRWRGRLWFLREPAALTGRAGMPPAPRVSLKNSVLWDRRFILSGKPQGLEIAPLGLDAVALPGARAGLFTGPPEALAAIPAIYKDDVLIGAPALPFMALKNVACQPVIAERFAGRCVRFP